MRVKKSEAVFLSLSFIIWTVLIALIGSCSHTNSSRGNFNRPQELDTYFSKQALSRAKTLSRAGEMAASKQELFDLLKRYPNTQAAEDAAILLIDWMVSENEIVKAKDFAWEFLIFHNKSDYTSRVRDRISKLDSVDQVKPDEKIDYWALLAASKEREKETLSFAEIEKSKQGEFYEDATRDIREDVEGEIGEEPQEDIKEFPRSQVSGSDVVLLAGRSTGHVAPQTIGVILPLTGKFSSYALSTLTAIRLGFGVNNFSKPEEKVTIDRVGNLEIVIIDSGGNPIEAARAVNKLVSSYGAIGVIGDILQDTSVVVAERCEAYGVPLISLSRKENLNLIGPWVFRLGMTSTEQVKALLDFSYFQKGHKKYAVLYPRHGYGQEMADIFIQYVNYVGADVVHIESYDPKQTTFTNLAKKITNKLNLKGRKDYQLCIEEARLIKNKYKRGQAQKSCKKNLSPEVGFEALFIPDFPKTVSYLVPALISSDVLVSDTSRNQRIYKKSTGYDIYQPVQLLGASSWNSDIIGKRLGRQIDGAYFVDGFSLKNKRNLEPGFNGFVKNFKAIVSASPKAIEFHAFDAAKIFAFLLGQVDDFKPTTREALRESLDNLRGFPGVVGAISFDSAGESVVPLQKFKFLGGEIKEISNGSSS